MVEAMSHGHHHHSHTHAHEHRAVASAPTFSLLRLSVGQRLAGTAIVLAGLWVMVLGVMG
jgi:hypothetical protein